MNVFTKNLVIILFVLLSFNNAYSKAVSKKINKDEISSYLSGIHSHKNNDFENSYKFFRKLSEKEIFNKEISKKYIRTLINLEKYHEAYLISKRLNKQNNSSFESKILISIFEIKRGKDSKIIRSKLSKENLELSSLEAYVLDTTLFWSDVENYKLPNALKQLNKLNKNYKNITQIQKTFLNCYLLSENKNASFINLIKNSSIDMTRYNYFYATTLSDSDKASKKDILKKALKDKPRNLILNQYLQDLEKKKINKNNFFSCKDKNHILAEIFYVVANALSSQNIYSLSNYYLNISKFLNPNFKSYDTLVAENNYFLGNLDKTIKIYKSLKEIGSVYHWHAAKQISNILIQQEKKKDAFALIEKKFQNLKNPNIYQVFDYAEFLKRNEKFNESIRFYSEVLNKINLDHNLFAKATDGRGVSYERIGKWKLAEKDLLQSLEKDPNQAYVLNYLAYSWIEQGIKLEKSIDMLNKANNLKKNDGYIIDSLGWAYFKMGNYKISRGYLQLAITLMPTDPTVNDHYGDCLWMLGKQIQARYYWKYVLNLKDVEPELKDEIKKKLIFGIKIKA